MRDRDGSRTVGGMTSTDLPTLVLIHGAWHGSWCWEHLLPHLERAGVDHTEVELPLSGHRDDVAAAIEAFDAVAGPKVAVGHSYGGHVLAGAAVGRTDLIHLVYVAAFMLATGNSVVDELGDLPGPLPPLFDAMHRTDDGRSAIKLDKAGSVFYNTSPPDWADAAIGRLRPMDPDSTSSSALGSPWESIPSTYVLCERDQTIPVAAQRAMATSRATKIVSFDTDHSPFLSAPEALARVFIAVAEKASVGG